MFLCLSLGFMGRYRQGRGSVELDQLRDQVHAAIATQRPTKAQELSRHWRGVAAPYLPGRRVTPRLGRVRRRGCRLRRIAVMDLLQPQCRFRHPAGKSVGDATGPHAGCSPGPQLVEPLPPAPAAPAPTALDQLRSMLQSDIDQQTLGVLGTPTSVTIRIPDRLVFARATPRCRSRHCHCSSVSRQPCATSRAR